MQTKLLIPKNSLKFDHCYMNLPVDAVEFLDVFVGLFKKANPNVWYTDSKDSKTLQLPMIHVYGFTQEKEKEKAQDFFIERIRNALKITAKVEGDEGWAFFSDSIDRFHNIRDVSSTSHMYSISFILPWNVAMGTYLEENNDL